MRRAQVHFTDTEDCPKPLRDISFFRQIIVALSIFLLAGCSIGDSRFEGPAVVAATPSSESASPLTLVATGGDTKEVKDIYAAIFPYYAELCALSEIKKKPGFGAEINGGFGGHSVLYLNGVCRDHNIDYPTIELCKPDTPELTATESYGVGLSVNDHFKNANWVATEGKDFLFYGSLKPGEALNKAAYERTQTDAKKLGILNGIKFHERFFAKMPSGISKRDYMYEISIATDYATNFGRDRYCAKVPMSRAQMAKVVAYLNHLNEPYRDGKAIFHWEVLGNNCSHMTHNALAAAGIWDAVDVYEPVFISVFDFPVPKNEFVNLIRQTNDLPLNDLSKLYADTALRDGFLSGGVMPSQAGALADVASIVSNNDLYDTDTRLIFYDPIGIYQRAFKSILANPRYFDIRANLVHFSSLYDELQANKKPVSWYIEKNKKVAGFNAEAFAQFYDRFYRYVGAEKELISQKLAMLDKLTRQDQPIMSSSTGTLNVVETQ